MFINLARSVSRTTPDHRKLLADAVLAVSAAIRAKTSAWPNRRREVTHVPKWVAPFGPSRLRNQREMKV